MGKSLTIDTSVIISAFNQIEKRHTDSETLMEDLKARKRIVVLPTLVRVEVAGVLSRTTGSPELARKAASFGFLPTHLVFVDLDRGLAEEAADIAAATGMKGADAVFVAVARRYDTVLVSLDRDHLERTPPGVMTCDPLEALSL